MSKYRCVECGKEFDEPEHWKEDRGPCFGYPAYEDMWGCPYCRGEYMTVEEYNREYGEDEESEEDEDENSAGI